MHKYNEDGSRNHEAMDTLMLYEIAEMIEDAPTITIELEGRKIL
jgi:hypothetical protein